MLPYQRIGVFLTGSPADSSALAYAGAFAQRVGATEFVCIYVSGGGEEPQAEPPDGAALEQQVRAAVPTELAAKATISVSHAAGLVEILRLARDQDLDLVAIGRRLPANEMAVATVYARLARKAPCSVLLVPAFVEPQMDRLHVAVDTSDHSRAALEQAIEFARAGAAGSALVLAHHVFAVEYGYTKVAPDMREAEKMLHDASDERMRVFLQGLDTSGVTFEWINTCSEDMAQAIHNLAAARKMDLIVIGSRGMSQSAAALLGSAAERVLLTAARPMLIVKRKGETIGFLNALLGG